MFREAGEVEVAVEGGEVRRGGEGEGEGEAFTSLPTLRGEVK